MGLSNKIRALIGYANETTEKADTRLGDAVKSLADGYKGGSVGYPLPTITDADSLSSQLTALIAYANGITGKTDSTIGDAVRSLVEGYGGGNPWEQYNQNGLVFQLDCDTQCTAEKWTDVIGGQEFISNGNVILDNGIPYFNGNAYYRDNNVIPHNKQTHTIEVVFVSSRFSTNFLIYREDKEGCVSLGYYPNKWLYISTSSASKGYATYNSNNAYGLNTISISDIGVQNGNTSTQGPDNYWGLNKTNSTYIGTREPNSGQLLGKIYAIRIYNRLLSQAEILANQQIDIERFSNR